MTVLITGVGDVVGNNLAIRLSADPAITVHRHGRELSRRELADALAQADVVYHMACASQPDEGMTALLCDEMSRAGRPARLLFASRADDTQAGTDLESRVLACTKQVQAGVHLFRLPPVFGKWSSVESGTMVERLCAQIANGAPVQIDDPTALLTLVYVDDVVDAMIQIAKSGTPSGPRCDITPVYRITAGELVRQIQEFQETRTSLTSARVGGGLARALYATYLSCLRPEAFVYSVQNHRDARGGFVEMLKTQDSGQFSFFTAHPGVTRGGHYHHSKAEKFLVAKGRARFRFRHMLTGDRHEVFTSGDAPAIVDTVPGWSHDITNVGDDEMIVMLWASEVFDRDSPDTFSWPL